MIFTVLGAVAELERNLIKERVAMGIHRARKQGKALGRPRVEVDPRQVAGLRARGLSWNQIAEHLVAAPLSVRSRPFPKNPPPAHYRRTHFTELTGACSACGPFPAIKVFLGRTCSSRWRFDHASFTFNSPDAALCCPPVAFHSWGT